MGDDSGDRVAGARPGQNKEVLERTCRGRQGVCQSSPTGRLEYWKTQGLVERHTAAIKILQPFTICTPHGHELLTKLPAGDFCESNQYFLLESQE